MLGRHWMIGAIVLAVVAQTGCVTCCHKGFQKALENGPEAELPAPCRNQVYVYLIDGINPTHSLTDLRIKLGENGFAKVGVADLAGGLCVESEIKSIRRCDPDARFVLVGYDVGAPLAVSAARDLREKKIRVEALVLLDPVACKEVSGLPTLLITSAKSTREVPHTQRMAVSDASHFALPTHPATVAAIAALLREVALNGYQPPGDPVPTWSYLHAPEMHPPVTGHWDQEWDFLSDYGPTRSLKSQSTSQPSGSPAPVQPPSTFAGPVMIKR
jgi:hypothetical protein